MNSACFSNHFRVVGIYIWISIHEFMDIWYVVFGQNIWHFRRNQPPSLIFLTSLVAKKFVYTGSFALNSTCFDTRFIGPKTKWKMNGRKQSTFIAVPQYEYKYSPLQVFATAQLWKGNVWINKNTASENKWDDKNYFIFSVASYI